MGISLQNCGKLSASAVASALNAECPKDMGDGMTMKSVVAQDNNVVATIEVGSEILGALSLQDSKTIAKQIGQELKNEAKTDSDVDQLLTLINANMNVVYRFTDGTNNFDLTITKEEIQ